MAWLRSHAIRRVGWGVADQAISSLTNFAVSLYVARTLGAVQLGAFSLAYVTYAFALNASRGLATDPLMVRHSAIELPAWRRAVAGCTATAIATGTVAGVCVIAAALALGGTTRGAFLAMGITLPGLMLQDSWRYSFFALGRGGQAFLNDCIWGLALLGGLAILRETGHTDVFWLVLAWGISASVAAAVGPLQARVMPRLSGIGPWLRDHRDLGPRYLAEGTANNAGVQLRSYVVGVILGLAPVGYVQASVTLMGPMTILFLGMGLVLLPEAIRVLRRSPQRLMPFCALVSAGLAGATLAWGIFLLYAVPRGLGAWLLGPIWHGTYPLVLPQMLYVVASALASGAGLGLHALGAARQSLRLAVFGSVVQVGFALIGAVEAGAAGAVSGMAAASCLGALLSWWQLRASLRRPGRHRATQPAPHWFR
jgi:O-antigen/teichoic acid export membrane protein